MEAVAQKIKEILADNSLVFPLVIEKFDMSRVVLTSDMEVLQGVTEDVLRQVVDSVVSQQFPQLLDEVNRGNVIEYTFLNYIDEAEEVHTVLSYNKEQQTLTVQRKVILKREGVMSNV